MNRLPTVLLVVALALVIIGVVLAIGRPGDLDDGGTETANGITEPADDDTTTTGAGGADGAGVTRTTGAGKTAPGSEETTSGANGDGPSPTPAASGRVGGENPVDQATTTTTAPGTGGSGTAPRGGSGLDGAGSNTASDVEDGLADTGGMSLLAPAAVIAAVALALPRRRA